MNVEGKNISKQKICNFENILQVHPSCKWMSQFWQINNMKWWIYPSEISDSHQLNNTSSHEVLWATFPLVFQLFMNFLSTQLLFANFDCTYPSSITYWSFNKGSRLKGFPILNFMSIIVGLCFALTIQKCRGEEFKRHQSLKLQSYHVWCI